MTIFGVIFSFYCLLIPWITLYSLAILMLTALVIVSVATQTLIVVISLSAILTVYVIFYIMVFIVMLDIRAEDCENMDQDSCVRSAKYNTVISYDNDEVFEDADVDNDIVV